MARWATASVADGSSCIGVVWFALASLLCGLAPNIETLVAARMLQGVGGALLTPGSLAIIQASFHPDDRARAIGAWSGFGGVTTAIGPFVGGYLVDAASWRWIFLLNLPLGALVLWVAIRHVPESRDPPPTGTARRDRRGARCRRPGGHHVGPDRALVADRASGGLLVLVVFVVVEGARATRCCRWRSSGRASSPSANIVDAVRLRRARRWCSS